MGPHLTTILKKQFEFAGHYDLYDTIDFTDEGNRWFHDLTWNEQQESEFKDWVIQYLKDNIRARKEVMTVYTRKTNKVLNEWFSWWNLMYGFRRNDIK